MSGKNQRVTVEAILAVPKLVGVLEDLHDSDIKVAIGWVCDAGIDLAIGDQMHGYKTEGQAATLAEAAEWLRRMAVKYYPDSAFAKKHAGAPHRRSDEIWPASRGGDASQRGPTVGSLLALAAAAIIALVVWASAPSRHFSKSAGPVMVDPVRVQ